MKKYPAVIDLAEYAHISDAEIAKDIADTEHEIAGLEATEKAEREIARSHPSQSERRMADFKADSRPYQREQRREFVAFLRRIQEARALAAPPTQGSAVAVKEAESR